jgi:hypothetical protein
MQKVVSGLLLCLLLTACAVGIIERDVPAPPTAPIPTAVPTSVSWPTATVKAILSPTPVPPPEVTPTSPEETAVIPTLSSSAGQIHWSPDGEYYATYYGTYAQHGMMIVSIDGRQASIPCGKWNSFYGWTADSQYALIGCYDQYGNMITDVFDTRSWAGVSRFPEECPPNMSGECKGWIAAIAPATPRVLLGNGNVVHLPGSVQSNVLTATATAVRKGAWSSSERHLAFLARDSNRDLVLYIAGGDGKQPVAMTKLNPEDQWPYSEMIKWAETEDIVIVETLKNRYTVQVATGQVEVVPISEEK